MHALLEALETLNPVPGQVRLAVELRKPLFLHCRDAADAFARILARHELSAPAVVHCFTGSARELTQFVGMGLHVGITGWVRPVCCTLCSVRAVHRGGRLHSALAVQAPMLAGCRSASLGVQCTDNQGLCCAHTEGTSTWLPA